MPMYTTIYNPACLLSSYSTSEVHIFCYGYIFFSVQIKRHYRVLITKSHTAMVRETIEQNMSPRTISRIKWRDFREDVTKAQRNDAIIIRASHERTVPTSRLQTFDVKGIVSTSIFYVKKGFSCIRSMLTTPGRVIKQLLTSYCYIWKIWTLVWTQNMHSGWSPRAYSGSDSCPYFSYVAALG